jgi:hypothetical protein
MADQISLATKRRGRRGRQGRAENGRSGLRSCPGFTRVLLVFRVLGSGPRSPLVVGRSPRTGGQGAETDTGLTIAVLSTGRTKVFVALPRQGVGRRAGHLARTPALVGRRAPTSAAITPTGTPTSTRPPFVDDLLVILRGLLTGQGVSIRYRPTAPIGVAQEQTSLEGHFFRFHVIFIGIVA